MSEAIVPSKNVKNRIGHKWGRWTVISFAGYNKQRQALWLCRCLCGGERVMNSGSVAIQDSQSCGCITAEVTAARNRTHGQYGTPEYRAWAGMKVRCYDIRCPQYGDYGGRGIKICARWLGPEGFQNFFNDMGHKPSAEHSIDRIDVNGGYEPGNCRWATRKEQRVNQRNPRLKMLTYKGETLTVTEWAERLGISNHTLGARIRRGWDVAKALEMPLDTSHSNPKGSRVTRGNVA